LEPNPQFTITRSLRPCRVTKTLLLDIERNVSATLADIAGEADKPRKATSLSILDADGEEVLTSSEQLAGDQFPNSTKQVQMELSVRTSGDEKASIVLTVRLLFKSSARPSLRIVFQCPRARDQAVGLEGRIMRLMDNSFDRSRFFHPPEVVQGIVWVASFIGGLGWLLMTLSLIGNDVSESSKVNPTMYFAFTVVLITVSVYRIVCSRYYPEVVFDTKHRAELDDQKSWAKKAVWSLIGVNILAAALLERLREYFGF
jgi:hypothetical protein